MSLLGHRLSGRKHLLEHGKRSHHSTTGKFSKAPHKPFTIHGPNLVQNDVHRPSLEPTCHTKRLSMSPGCEGCNDECPRVRVQFIRRHNHARASFANLVAPSRVQMNQIRNKNFHAPGTESTPVPARRSMPNAPVRAAAGSSRCPPAPRGDRRRPFRYPLSAPAAPPPRTRPTTSASRHPPTLACLPTHGSVPAPHSGAAAAPAHGPARASTPRRSRCTRIRCTTLGSVNGPSRSGRRGGRLRRPGSLRAGRCPGGGPVRT